MCNRLAHMTHLFIFIFIWKKWQKKIISSWALDIVDLDEKNKITHNWWGLDSGHMAVTLDESLLRVSDKTSNNYERVPALKKHSRWLSHHIQVALITCTQVLLSKYCRCQLFIKYPFTRGNLVYQLHRLKLLEWKITADLGSKAVTDGLAWCAGFGGGGGDGSLIRPLVSIITGNIHANITANPEMNHLPSWDILLELKWTNSLQKVLQRYLGEPFSLSHQHLYQYLFCNEN